jgi:uncharacterized membrane protein (UPF0127 family)
MVGSGPVPRAAARSPLPFALALALAAGTACAREPAGPRVVVESGGRSHVVAVEVADDDARRERGLMFRRDLPEDRGMLFVFGAEGEHPFWMKDTLIPLDMIFIDSGGRITGIVERAQPLSLQLRSGGPSRFVLEVQGGWAARRGVKAGDTARLEGIVRAAPPQ